MTAHYDRVDLKRRQLNEVALNKGKSPCTDQWTVGQVMTTSPISVPSGTTVLQLIELFHEKHFRHLLVTDDAGRLEGLISDRDVLRCLGPDDKLNREMAANTRASSIMARDLVTVRPTTGLHTAIDMMIAEGISCLPVVSDDRLLGITTNTDMLICLDVLLETEQAPPAQAPKSTVKSEATR